MARGRGVKVAVIDSGVNPRQLHIQNVAGGVVIGTGMGKNSPEDLLGHGTAVLATIQEKVPEAQFYVIKIYHRSLRANINSLLTALHWAISEGADVINLSVGTVNTTYYNHFVPIVKRANDAGSLIVAAAKIDSTRCLPGSMPGVIGVGLDWTCLPNGFRMNPSDDGPLWLASGSPRSLPGVAPNDNLRGISFSVANMSGFVARACERTKERSPEGICKVLQDEEELLNSAENQMESS